MVMAGTILVCDEMCRILFFVMACCGQSILLCRRWLLARAAAHEFTSDALRGISNA